MPNIAFSFRHNKDGDLSETKIILNERVIALIVVVFVLVLVFASAKSY